MTKRKNFSEGVDVHKSDKDRIWHCAEDNAGTTVRNYDTRPIDRHGNKVELSTTIGGV